MLEKRAIIKVYEPKAMETAKIIFNNKIEYYNSSYDTLENANALLILTEWNEFRCYDFNRIRDTLKDNIIFDGRNIYDRKVLESRDLKYIRI